MILATYQCLDWETYKNPRYSDLKKVLGISQDNNIYWCFPANNIYQGLINSCCIEPNQPHVFIMFETEDYYIIDKIKWNRIVENKGTDLSDVLTVSHIDAAEYIVTSIPDKRFEFRLDFKNCKQLAEKSISQLQKNYLFGFVNNDRKYNIVSNYWIDAQFFYDNIGFSNNSNDKTASEILLKAASLKLSFDTNLFIPIYYWALSLIKSDVPETVNLLYKHSPIIAEEIAQFRHELTSYNTAICTLSDDKAYSQLKTLFYSVYRIFFGAKKLSGIKTKPNETCPCGSGKKFKKCCGVSKTVDDVISYMVDGL